MHCMAQHILKLVRHSTHVMTLFNSQFTIARTTIRQYFVIHVFLRCFMWKKIVINEKTCRVVHKVSRKLLSFFQAHHGYSRDWSQGKVYSYNIVKYTLTILKIWVLQWYNLYFFFFKIQCENKRVFLALAFYTY